jgi:hypothetical protein
MFHFDTDYFLAKHKEKIKYKVEEGQGASDKRRLVQGQKAKSKHNLHNCSEVMEAGHEVQIKLLFISVDPYWYNHWI